MSLKHLVHRMLLWSAVITLTLVSPLAAVADSLTLHLPSALLVIGPEAFAGTTAETVILPAGIRSIGARAFAGSSVREVVMPFGPCTIDDTAFEDCAPDLVLRVQPGSPVESWAKSHGYLCLYPGESAGCSLAFDSDAVTDDESGMVVTLGRDASSIILTPTMDRIASVACEESEHAWLTASLDGASLVLSADANPSHDERTQNVTVTCRHGQTTVLQVHQEAGLRSAIALVIDDESLSRQNCIGRYPSNESSEVTLSFRLQNIAHLSVSVVDSAGHPAAGSNPVYNGPANDTITFTLPSGLREGIYQLYITGTSCSDNYGPWNQTVSVAATLDVISTSANPPKLYSNVSTLYKNSVYCERLLQVNLTGNKAFDIVQVAKSQTGYHEGRLDGTGTDSSNVCEYAHWQGYATPWCACFVSWCALLADAKCITASIHATPAYMLTSAEAGHVYSFRTYDEVVRTSTRDCSFMLNANRCTYTTREEFMPRMGDLIYIWSGSYMLGHIGIVSHVSDGRVYYYDGNGEDMDMVKLSSRLLTDDHITMYGRPNY